jgi:hypothetical protein
MHGEGLSLKLLEPIVRALERERGPRTMLAAAIVIAAAYVLVTFDISFLLGSGPFWANPRGPWLMDPQDHLESIDVMTTQVAYIAFLHAPWNLPLFFTPALGAPGGSSVILVDAVPIVALLGKILFSVSGLMINPYGIWSGACFVLSAVFAVLLMRELGQRSLLAEVAGGLLAVSMPALLHRFGHLSLRGQFIVIGGLWLYARDTRVGASWRRSAWWAGWLCLAALLHGYLFAMAAALYAATWLSRLQRERSSVRGILGEPALIALCVGMLLLVAGHFGKGTGTSPSAGGYGYFSMNLLSPFWPQRSGLFPMLYNLEIGPDGQYEGFNYLGAGVLVLLATALVLFGRSLPAALRRHSPLIVVLTYLALYAVSDAVFLGSHQLLYIPLPEPLAKLAGVFRSSGRMFWPCGYAIALFGLAFVLRRLRTGWRTAVVLSCCVLQLIDTNPLRARLTMLTERSVPTVLNRDEWERRIALADKVHIVPSFYCTTNIAPIQAGAAGADAYIVHLELQRAAMTVGRPIDSVNNPRLAVDCSAASEAVLRGPSDERTLSIYLTDILPDIPKTWRPPGLACHSFDHGFWCLGRAAGDK